jgi:chitinase
MKTLLLSLQITLVIVIFNAGLALPNLCYGQQIKPQPVIIGYVGGYRGKVINTEDIPVFKFTHINYAFVNVEHNRAVLSHEGTDTINLRNLVLLKKKNPALKILISLGGWTWSGNFSDAVLTDTSRQAFATSAVDMIRKFGLDGIDIDWEYPDMAGSGHIHRPEDKQNYTLMFEEIRRQLDILQQQTGRRMFLTTAAGGFKSFLNHTEMSKASQYLDYINLMTYDYNGDGRAIHHTNLYTDSKNDREDSGDKAVKAYLAGGVPASKLVLGIAFYGRVFQLSNSALKGLGDTTISQLHINNGYTFLKDSLINRNGFKEYQDTVADAPYLFNAKTRQFISYDNEWSVKNKCKYVLDNKLAGVMFWEYDSDLKDYLLNQIDATLLSNKKGK